MADFNSKPYFQRLFRPIANGLGRRGVTANQVTVAAMVVSAFAGIAVLSLPDVSAAYLAVPGALLVRLVCNHIDGMIARTYGSQSRLGQMLNEQGDVFCDSVLYFPLVSIAGVHPPLVIVAVVGALICEMTGVLGNVVGSSRREDGPMSKKPRGVIFGGIYLALAFGVPAGPWIDSLLVMVILLLALTVVRRTVGALKEARS